MGDPQQPHGEIEAFFRNSKLPLPEGLLSLTALTFCLATDPVSPSPSAAPCLFFCPMRQGDYVQTSLHSADGIM